MRLSCEQNDPGYRNWLAIEPDKRAEIKVTLNGDLLKRVFMADESLGLAKVARLDDRGDVYLIGDEIATETRRGSVSIEVPAK
jgi:hypothetical protein